MPLVVPDLHSKSNLTANQILNLPVNQYDDFVSGISGIVDNVSSNPEELAFTGPVFENRCIF